jgi:pimeloyl-ACP methyl ester carboxylesterase
MDAMSGRVTSQDGTTITFLEYGAGPGLVIVPGNNRRAHHYASLAGLLADSYRVTVIDRRGRGLSGPQGPDYSVDREAEDAPDLNAPDPIAGRLAALMRRTSPV